MYNNKNTIEYMKKNKYKNYEFVLQGSACK